MIESKQRSVHVVYRRQVSDGNYGTESAEVSLDWFVDNDEATQEDLSAAEEMLAQARDVVLEHLRRSPSEGVRRSVAPRTTKPVAMASAGTAATAPADDEDPF